MLRVPRFSKIFLFSFVLLIIGTEVTAEYANKDQIGLILSQAKVNHHVAGQFNTRQDFNQDKSNVQSKATSLIRGGAVEPQTAKALYGIAVMAAIEYGLKKLFLAVNINFPSQLGGCIFLFALAVLSQSVVPGTGDKIQDFLDPGCALLSKWLPCFFVPGLAMLPLAPSIGSAVEVLKFLSVIAIGLVYSLTTISYAVLSLRLAQGAKNEPIKVATVTPKKNKRRAGKKGATPVAALSAPVKPFSTETLKFLSLGSLALLACSVGALRMETPLATPLQTAALIFSTLAGFVWAARMPAKVTKVIHPLVTSSAVTLVMAQCIGLGVGSSMKDVLKSYKVGSLNPMKMGAGDLLLWLLGPSVVSFAVSMYSRKQLIYENLIVITVAIFVSVVGGLFATAGFARLINLGGSDGLVAKLSVLPRNVTTALAMVIASIIGGDISITAVGVVLTGVLGATYGKTLMNALGLHDPVTRGLSMGGAAQGLGTAAMSNEPDAFPFAAIGMVLTAVFATTLVSIPFTRDALIRLAVGGSPVP